MKSQPKSLKLSALLLSVIVLMQSCSVYKSTPITINDAILSNKPVKVETDVSDKYKFDRIWREGEKLYGIESKYADDSDELAIELDESMVKYIYPKNKSMSTILTVALSAGVFIGILAILTSGGSYGLGGFDPTFNPFGY